MGRMELRVMREELESLSSDKILKMIEPFLEKTSACSWAGETVVYDVRENGYKPKVKESRAYNIA